jgi:beta-glucanase (GH16 family)
VVKAVRPFGVLTALFLVVWLVVNPVTPRLAASGPPHIMVLMMENQGYSDIIGNSGAPYMNHLASTYETATNYSAVGHYSLDNYLAAVSGLFDPWSTGDCSPGAGCQSSDPTIAGQFDTAGIPWAAYMGGMTTNCETSNDGGSGGYGVRHDPFVYYPALVSSDCAKIRPAGTSANWSAPTAMNTALNSSSPPDFVWFSPSICDDAGQDASCASIAAGDQFLSTEIPTIQSSSWYQAGGEIVLVFDESSSGSQGEDTSSANRVLTVLVSAATQGHANLTSYVNHFGLLAGLERAYGLPCLAGACQAANGVLPLVSSGPPPTTTTSRPGTTTTLSTTTTLPTTTSTRPTTTTTIPSGRAVKYDFEDGGTDGWSVDYGSARIANSTARAFSGTHSLAITFTGAGNPGIMSPNPTSGLTPSTPVTYEIYAPVAIQVQPYASDTSYNYTFSNGTMLSAGKWNTVTFTPGGSNVMYLGVEIESATASTGTLYLDAVSWGGPPPPPPTTTTTIAATTTTTRATTTTTQPVTTTTVPSGPVPQGPGGTWNMVFDDEFSGSSVDTAKWSYCYPWGACNNAGNNELEWYQPQNVTEGNGALSLTARKQAAHGFAYTSGLIQTDGKFDYKYGYAEIRAKLPPGQGMWPAFWMLPTSQAWPPEIDAVEQYQDAPDDVTLTVHYGTSSNPQIDQFDYVGPNFQTGWHIYGVDWEPSGITWYIDGHAVFHSGQVVNEQMYILLDLAIAGNPAPNAQTPFPSSLQVDYLRVWQH